MLKLGYRSRPRVVVPLAALIDVVFLLLIYFLLTSSFVSRTGLKLELPEAGTSAPVTGPIVVEVDRRGEIFFEGRPLSTEGLEHLLNRKIARGETRSVLIRADRRAPLQAVVSVMEVARRAGARGVALAVRSRPKP